ncbi:MAG TPA: outer membrane beta-barrel protein [Fluviicola sp.]|nr:outer membrane beta-barrel protein [Fluviicola sp.]
MQRIKSVLFILSFVLLAQKAHAQANYMGSFIVDPYYGAPNLDRLLWDTGSGATNVSGYASKSIGPFGIRGEYMLSDQFGLGFDLIYATLRTSYTEIDSVYNSSTDSFDAVKTDVETKNRRLRMQLRFNYHFAVSNPNLDAYMGVGAGSNTRFRSRLENGVEVEDTDNLELAVIPVSFRICAGMRYYFSPFVGINAELGLGGPLISAGLSFRL